MTYRDRRGRYARHRRTSHRRRHAAAHASPTRGGFMGISPMIWATLLGGGAFLWWSNQKKNAARAAAAAPTLPQVPTGAATPIPQAQPVNLTPSAEPIAVAPSGVVPGSIWV